MSAGVGIWKDVLFKAAHIPVRKPALATPAPVLSPPALQPISSLVQQIFFPAATVQRTHVLFAAADAWTNVSAVCEQVGRVLSEMSGATVAITESSPSPSAASSFKKRPRNGTRAERWRNYSSQITENLWRVPSGLMSNRHHPAEAWISAETGELPFDYVLFAAVVTDSECPCSAASAMGRSWCSPPTILAGRQRCGPKNSCCSATLSCWERCWTAGLSRFQKLSTGGCEEAE